MPRRRDDDELVEPEEMPSEASAEEPPRRVEPQAKAISVIETAGASVVVQWIDEEEDYHKSTVPATEVKDGMASAKALTAGEEPFNWEAAGLDPIWAKALRKSRIFDPQDYGKNPARAVKAIHRTITETITRIVKENRK